MNQKADEPGRDQQMARLNLSCRAKTIRTNFPLSNRHQTFPGTTQCQLNSESGRQKQIDFSGLDFLQIARGNLCFFGQFVLSQEFADPLATHVCAKNLNSFPLSFRNRHDILHRFPPKNVNDTYIVKKIWILLAVKAQLRDNGGKFHQRKIL
jgi:hypothetical protein